MELINFPDTGGVIGPITSAKLYCDFATFAPKAERHYAISTARRGRGDRATRAPLLRVRDPFGKLVVKAKGSVRIDGAAISESAEGD